MKVNTRRSLPTTGLYLEKSHPRKDGLLPLKVRVSYRRNSRFYKTEFFLSLEQYEDSHLSQNVRGKNKKLKSELEDLLTKSKGIIKNMDVFTFAEFEKQYYRANYDNDDLANHFKSKIDGLSVQERYSSADAYKHTLAKLQEFFLTKSIRTISLTDITVQNLHLFESWMDKNGYSISTTGIYLRSLRHIMNKAIRKGDIPQGIYPFGKEQEELYTIPTSRNVKKARTLEEIKTIIEVDLTHDRWKAKARDFWLLSFFCNGINMNDLLRWKYSDIDDGVVSFFRGKTKNTKKTIHPTQIHLTQHAVQIIDKYKCNGDYIFDVIEPEDSELKKRNKIRNFNRFVNQHMKVVAEELSIVGGCSLICARHSWATCALNKSVPIEFISSGLSHNSINTTRNYLKGFDKRYLKRSTELIFEDI